MVLNLRINQQLMVDVLLETKNRLNDVQNMIENAEREGERVALIKAADELKNVIRRNLT